MIKLLIVGQLPPPHHGSNVMAEIMLSVLKRKCYEVFFIDKGFSKNIRSIGKFSFSKLFRSFSLAFEILIKILSIRPSLCIYFPAVGKSAFLLDAFYLFIFRKCRTPYVLRFGGKGYKLLKNEGFFWKKIVSSTLLNATGGIVLGETMKWDVNDFISPNRLISVPSGVPGPKFETRFKTADRIQVLYLANLVPTKGPMEVLKAAKIVLEKNKNIFFVLAGSFRSNQFKEEIFHFINENRLEEFVRLPGAVHGEMKEKLFNSSDIFLFPTYYEREVFGTVNIEAMSYGLPVISSFEGAIPEVVQDGYTGFIVNPKSPTEIAEKILLLANNPLLRKTIGERGKEVFTQKYTLNAHGENLDSAVIEFLQFVHEDKDRSSSRAVDSKHWTMS